MVPGADGQRGQGLCHFLLARFVPHQSGNLGKAGVMSAIVPLCEIGLVLYGGVAVAELAVRRGFRREIAVGGFV